MVELKTRGIPQEPSCSLVFGNVEGSTFQTGLGHQESLDWTGFGTAGRKLPAAVAAASDENPLEETDMFGSRGYPIEELERFGELMPNHWGLTEQLALPVGGVDFAAGRGFTFGELDYGFLFAGLWKHGWDFEEFTRDYFVVGAGDKLERSHQYVFTELSRMFDWSCVDEPAKMGLAQDLLHHPAEPLNNLLHQSL